MSWGKGIWGRTRWGTIGEVEPKASKFHSYLSATKTARSRFHSSVAFSPTPLPSKFHSYLGVDVTPIGSKFHSWISKLLLTCFHSYTSIEAILESQFHSYVAGTKTTASKFHGLAGATQSQRSRFHGYLKIDRLLASKFHGLVGRTNTQASKFHGMAGSTLSTASKFIGYTSIGRDTATKFHGLIGRIPIQITKFHSYCFRSNYYEIAGIDISSAIRDLKPDGWGLKVSTLPLPGNDDVELADQGTEAGRFSVIVKFLNEIESDTFLKTVTNQLEDTTCKMGRSDRYTRVKRVTVVPVENLYLRQRFTHQVILHINRKTQIAVIGETFGGGLAKVLPSKSQSMTNIGSAPALITFAVQGYYDAGHSQSLSAKLYNGATVLRTLPISTKLLSDEIATLDEDGVMTFTYYDTYDYNTKYVHDATVVNCTFTAGKIRINPSGYLEYKLSGPLLMSKNIKATLDLLRVAGSPTIKVSTDGVTFTDSIPYAELKDGSENYWLTGSAKYPDVWVRINCPAGATLDVLGLAFEVTREIASTGYYNQLPVVAAGDSRALEIIGTGGSGKAKVAVTLNSRWFT